MSERSQPRASRRTWALVIALAGLSLSSLPAQSAPPLGDVWPLGRSAASGAVCQASRNFEDGLSQRPGARAWAIRCLGWDVQIGRIYKLPVDDGVREWRADIDARAACDKVETAQFKGLGAGERKLCRNRAAGTPYVTLVARRGRFAYVAEGFPQVVDVLETGLAVAAGVMPPPDAAQSQSSQAAAALAADFGGDLNGLAVAEKSAPTDTSRLMQRGYLQNSEWRFDLAASDFRALAAASQSTRLPTADRARALLNLALNISNTGRFAEASTVFDSADPVVAAAGDRALTAESLTYRAHHLRNQSRFEEAAEMAQRALDARRSVLESVQATGTGSTATTAQSGHAAGDTLTIDAHLADALNMRSESGLLSGDTVSEAVRLAMQDAETQEILGASLLASGKLREARAVFEQARANLKFVEDNAVEAVRLRARVEGDIGDLELASDHAAAAVERYDAALKILKSRHAGSPPVGGLLMDLGRADIAAGHTEAALAAYDEAFAIFTSSRGSLGASADAAQPYLDLLIDLIRTDPGKASLYADRFFQASEAVVSETTASAISRLAARVASGDNTTAGLVRALDDTRRDLAAAQSRIALLQSRGAYSGEAKASADADADRLRRQLASVNSELLTANPRYDQLVSSKVTLADLQHALRPGEVYVKNLLLSDHSYGLLISREQAVPYVIPIGRSEAVNSAMALREPMQASDEGLASFDVAGSYKLFQALFGPIAPSLLAAKHLVYDPDSELVSLPVAVFVTDKASVDLVKQRKKPGVALSDYRGVAWLGARLDSSLVLSAVSFLQSRTFKPSRAARPYLAFADPELARTDPRAYQGMIEEGANELAGRSDPARARRICDASRRALLRMEALPDTRREVQIIAASVGVPNSDVVMGRDFDDASIRTRKDLENYKIIYFATHALLSMPDACLPEPALLTSLGAKDSQGLLTSSEIVNLKLDAELVVLSACDTGSSGGGGMSSGGEALGGLTRAFIYAGARGLIVSHWSVDSSATERLMTVLFTSRARTQAEGLQESQALMQADEKLSHPYYWAPFTVVGDGARPIPTGAKGRPSSES